MNIKSINIGGIANIDYVELDLSHLNALIAFNNYGKSNIMKAIKYGISFIKATPEQKLRAMGDRKKIPINIATSNKPYSFEIVGNTRLENEEYVEFTYKYTFKWLKNKSDEGRKIESEDLKVKRNNGLKYTSYIKRNNKGNFYMSSPTGRCDREILIDDNNLILNKIVNFDDLFYIDILNEILSLDILLVDTLQDPDSMFSRIIPINMNTEKSLNIKNNMDDACYFIYRLMTLNPDLYELFLDSVKSLLPTIEELKPIEVDLKELGLSNNKESEVPFSLPEKLYDIRIKEKYNNQQTSIKAISSGSKRIIYTLAMCIGAEINKLPLIMFEELENSIHPGLFQNLLITLDELCKNTKIIISSHSPYLIKYLSLDKIKIGLPNDDGIAKFKGIKKTKEKSILRLASDEGVSIGDYIFSLMVDASLGDTEPLNDICR
ncbi:MAG: AAA family ATPase [Rikenellaceae bacterium]